MSSPEIEAKLGPILSRHWETAAIIKERCVTDRGVVSFDLVGTDIEGYNKFIPYYYHPDVTYVVSLSQSTFRTKISVGSNPWAPPARSQHCRDLREIRRRRTRCGRCR